MVKLYIIFVLLRVTTWLHFWRCSTVLWELHLSNTQALIIFSLKTPWEQILFGNKYPKKETFLRHVQHLFFTTYVENNLNKTKCLICLFPFCVVRINWESSKFFKFLRESIGGIRKYKILRQEKCGIKEGGTFLHHTSN